jgi:hypothetical protein
MNNFVGTNNIFNPRTYTQLFYFFIFLYVRYIYWLMSLILNIVINFFNKKENISLGYLIYLLYVNNYSFNQIIFFDFGPPDFKLLAPPLMHATCMHKTCMPPRWWQQLTLTSSVSAMRYGVTAWAWEMQCF